MLPSSVKVPSSFKRIEHLLGTDSLEYRENTLYLNSRRLCCANATKISEKHQEEESLSDAERVDSHCIGLTYDKPYVNREEPPTWPEAASIRCPKVLYWVPNSFISSSWEEEFMTFPSVSGSQQ